MQIIGAHTFVLEIGSEELQAQDVSSAIGQACRGVQPIFEDHSNACNLFQLLITMDQKLYVHFAIHRCLKVRRLKHGRISVFGTPQRVTVSLCDYYIQGEIPLW